MTRTANRVSAEVGDRAKRMVLDDEGEHPSHLAEALSISAKNGCSMHNGRHQIIRDRKPSWIGEYLTHMRTRLCGVLLVHQAAFPILVRHPPPSRQPRTLATMGTGCPG